MKKVLTLIVLTLLLSATSAWAVPALRGVKKQIKLADGTTIMTELKGDEYMNYYSTVDGRALKLKNDKFQFVNLDSLKAVGMKRFNERNAARLAQPRKRANAFTGMKKGLVILVNLKDVKFTTPADDWNDYFNLQGYSAHGMGGSVHDYFYEQSYGTFDLEFDVVGPVEAEHNSVYYAANDGYYVADLVKQVCADIDNQVDFTQYDWDNDGYVDQVYVVYAGYGSAQGATNTIWPHEWKLSGSHLGTSYQTEDGVKVNTYACSCELHGDGEKDTGKMDGIGTACHEFSHCLGLPDFYDTNDSGNFGMDVWDLLDYGCYNGDYGYVPCSYTSYERMFAGWLNPIELTENTRISNMPCITDEAIAYIIYNKANRNEYYLLENHQQKGFDSEAYGHGMMVLHVDYDAQVWKNNTVNVASNRQRMTIVPADAKFGTTGNNASGDPYPGTSNNTSLTNSTSPAATLYNENSDGKLYLNAPITNIDETDGLITFDFNGDIERTAPVANDATDVSQENACFTANWSEVSGARQYTVKVTKVEEDDPNLHKIFVENFENCYSQISGTSKEISSKLDKYTTNPGWTGANLYRSPHNLRVGNTEEDGWVKTPEINAPTRGGVTFVIGMLGCGGEADAEMHLESSNGTPGTANITNITSATSGASKGEYAYYCFNLEPWTHGDSFNLTFSPSEGSNNFFLGFLGIYDGIYAWSDFEESSLDVREESNLLDEEGTTNSPALAPAAHRLNKLETETSVCNTTDTSHTFKVKEPGIYVYQVRTVTDEGNGNWSNKITVDMTGVVGIHGLNTNSVQSVNCVYDLQGRRITEPSRGLYVKNGKKYIIK